MSSELLSVFPPSAAESEHLEDIIEIVETINRCEVERAAVASSTTKVSLPHCCARYDETLRKNVIEVFGSSALVHFPVRTAFPLLTLDIHELEDTFCGIELSILTRAGDLKHVFISDRVSSIRSNSSDCTLPMSLVKGGWSHLSLDLSRIIRG